MILFDPAGRPTNLPARFHPNQNPLMPEIQVKKGEPVDRALKRLKTKLEAEGILEEVRRLRAFETPKERLRRKARAAAKRGKIRFRFQMGKPASAEKTEGPAEFAH
jgi:small subunit ribosomal protein S21